METEIQTKTYELAYHIIPDFEEAEVKARSQEINSLVSQNGGSIIADREPRRVHLSYPIKNKNYAYFGIMDFTAEPTIIEKINAQLKLQNGILRYLLLVKPESKEVRTLGEYRARQRMVKTHETKLTETQKAPLKKKTVTEEKELEQEVEKVIEGL